jgi:hypothetical protein
MLEIQGHNVPKREYIRNPRLKPIKQENQNNVSHQQKKKEKPKKSNG